MNIYITLDYELFLNDITGDVEHCLIIPTQELLKVLNKHQVRATFFVDMAYIYRINELRSQYLSLQEDYEKVIEQVKTLALNNHKIGLHLHPQWFYSKYNGIEWTVDFEHYKLSDMPEEEACEKFEDCHKMLEKIIGRKVDAFRAGGFSIQTFNPFGKLMIKCGILKDSTVIYKGRLLSNLHYYDYSNLKSPELYKFNEDIARPIENGNITEFPISTTMIGLFPYCLNRYKYHKAQGNSNWGNGGDLPSNRRTGFIRSIFRKLKPFVGVGATIDYQSFFNLEYVYKKYKKRRKNSFIILGHPKNLSPLSIQTLDLFITKTIEQDNYKTI